MTLKNFNCNASFKRLELMSHEKVKYCMIENTEIFCFWLFHGICKIRRPIYRC